MNAINPDQLPAWQVLDRFAAGIAAQMTPAFDLSPPEPTAAPTLEAIRAHVEAAQSRHALSQARVAEAIGTNKQNLNAAMHGKRGRVLTAEQWRALQSLAKGASYPQTESDTPAKPPRCPDTPDMFATPVDNSITDGVELAHFSPDEGKTEEPAPDPLSHLPDAMRPARRWLLWKAEPEPGKEKPRKVPYYANGRKRTKTDTPEDRAQLVTLAEARAALASGTYTGLGFALGPDEDGHHWQGIDLDGTDTRPELAALVEQLPGYVERSPSGKGWHALGIGRDFATLGSNATGIEAYAHGRYFTVTGNDGRGDLEDIADFVAVTLSPLHSPRAKAKDAPIERPHVDTTDQMIRDLRSALASMRSNDRDLWIRMGLALKPLGDQGRALWLEWSQTSEKFDPRDAARVWESFKPEGTGPAAVFAEAQRNGWVNPAKRERKTNTRRPIEPEREPGADTGPAPTDHTPPPWFGKIPPSGWKLTRNMVFEVKEKAGDTPDEYIPTCGPLWVVGRTTGAHGQWGLVLGFLDHNGHEQRLALPAARLHGDPSALVGDLSEMGLKTLPGREKKTLAYLGAWDVDERILSAKRLGWLEDPTGALAFVMPDHVIGRDGNRELVYQPDRYSPTVKTVHAAGSLEQWRAHVARPAGDHPPMLFALCAGLAPALLAFAEGADSFVVHFWGTTSRGKTTLGQLAASAWGCAADPADAPSLAFIRRWNLTGNGLEGLAEAHSDLPLVLDELGAATVGDIRPLVYQIAGGMGKVAMNSAREMREPRSWRTIAISTGEMSLHARMADPDQDGKRARSIKGGLTHRALDVEVSDIAAAAPKEQREALVSGIKQACARYYGTAGPEFVRRLAARFGTMAEARAHVRALVETILSEIATPGLPTETRRALRRFALIAAAGELASELGVMPVAPADIRAAAQSMARSWLSASAETDEQRIIASIRAFILAHESRFERVNEPQRFDGGGIPIKPDPVRDRVGFVDAPSGLWWFTDAGLAEASPGHDKTAIARTLRAAGHLHTDDKDRLTCHRVIPGEKRTRLYLVKNSVLECDQPTKQPGTPGTPGTSQTAQGPEPSPVGKMQPGIPGTDNRGRSDDGASSPPSSPVSPVPGTQPGMLSSLANTGDSPVSPVSPEKNTVTEKNQTGDAGANDGDEELF